MENIYLNCFCCLLDT